MALRRSFQTCCVAILVSSYLACSINNQEDDKLIAQVFDKKLYETEVVLAIPAGLGSSDSLLHRNAFIERWIRENLMMVEAERNLPPDLGLEQLVADYKASMIQHQYEKQLVEKLLDTIIDPEELRQYYDDNKDQYLLETVIVRCRFIHLAADVDEKYRAVIQTQWTSSDSSSREEVLTLVNQYAQQFYLSDSIWHTLDAIKAVMPPGSVNNAVVRNNREVQIANDNGYYFLKILEVRDEKEIAPLTFIESQASKVILHKRKLELLEGIKEDLYQRASSQNRIKIYTR